jgi:hypothetical protein
MLAVLLALSGAAFAQVFRGGIHGTITDPSGAAVAAAQVEAVESSTNTSYKMVSSSAGEFAFSNLPLGSYSITVKVEKFKTIKIDKVQVEAGVNYTLPIKLSVASASEIVEVTANALALDTVTDDQAAILSESAVENLPSSGRDFTQLLGLSTGFGGLTTGGGGYLFTINGSRSNDVNYEIEGTDNNDLWWNMPAVNQTGVNGIAAVLLPMDAIENFSVVTSGSAALGRNPGATANLTIRSGGNLPHGTVYYYNHNEFFQTQNPFADTKPETRNQHIGFSFGGPIRKDKTFFFVAGEKQWFTLGAAGIVGTEPTAAYQSLAQQLMANVGNQYGNYAPVAVQQVPLNLLNGSGSTPGLWPSNSLTGPGSPSNYPSTGNVVGYSYNSIIKLDEILTSKDHLSMNWFYGNGEQTAPYGGSALPWYFQFCPSHIQNYSVVYNRVLSTHMTNQLSAGVSYFNQNFGDANTSMNPSALGLITGSTTPGSPKIKIGPSSTSGVSSATSATGFDPVGVTEPSGRIDGTGHLDEDLNWTIGAHQLHFGGEYRHEQVFEYYLTNSRGTLYFDGSQGPWSTLSTSQLPNADGNVAYLADFLAGLADPTVSNITLGNPRRTVKINTFSLYAQDAWKVLPRLSIDYGIRYDYEGVPYTGLQDLSVFDPSLSTGLAVVGKNVSKLYNSFNGAFSPRIGFAYQLDKNNRAVMRGGYGLYYDSIYLKELLQNVVISNGGVFGPQFNPAGSNQVVTAAYTGNSSTPITAGSPVFQGYSQALSGQGGAVPISTFDRNFRPAYMQNYDLNVQYSIVQNVMAQIGYVGTKGTHLAGVSDLNQAALGSYFTAVPYNSPTCSPLYSGAIPGTPGNNVQCSRPYFNQFPNLAAINELRSNLGSNYNSMQAILKLVNYHGLSGQGGYTWAHALDYETGLLPYLPQSSLNEHAEYGNSDYDTRQVFSGYLNYAVPYWAGPKRLTSGWEINTGFSFHGGIPFTVGSSTGNTSGTSEGNDRAQLTVANPFAGISHAIQNLNGTPQVQWYSTTAFVDPAPGTYSTTRRNQFHNPGFGDFDMAIVKNTPITERVSMQIRADIFNLFNRTNLAPIGVLAVSGPASESNPFISGTIGSFVGNPGIGPGEPRNAQLSARISF